MHGPPHARLSGSGEDCASAIDVGATLGSVGRAMVGVRRRVNERLASLHAFCQI